MEIDTINARISLLIENQKITTNSFATKLQTKATVIYNILKGRNKPGYDLLKSIVETFGVNANWLITGNGSMYTNDITNVDLHKVGKAVNPNEFYLKEKVLITDKVIEDIISKTFSSENLSIKTNKLREFQASYTRKINSELRRDEKELYNMLEIAEDLEALCDLIWTTVSDNINCRPNPFEPMQYLNLGDKSENLPSEIDYNTYKENVISWLQRIFYYRATIDEFFVNGNDFLKKLQNLNIKN